MGSFFGLLSSSKGDGDSDSEGDLPDLLSSDNYNDCDLPDLESVSDSDLPELVHVVNYYGNQLIIDVVNYPRDDGSLFRAYALAGPCTRACMFYAAASHAHSRCVAAAAEDDGGDGAACIRAAGVQSS